MTHGIYIGRQRGVFAAIVAFFAIVAFSFTGCNKVTNTGSTDDATRYLGTWNGINLKGETFSITFVQGATGVKVLATIPVGNPGCVRDTVISGYANGNVINFPPQTLRDDCDNMHMVSMYGTLEGYVKDGNTGKLTIKLTMGWLPGGQQTYVCTRGIMNEAARFVGLWKGTSTGSGLGSSITFNAGDNQTTFSLPYMVGVNPCENYINIQCVSTGDAFTISSQDFNDGCGIPATTIYGDGSLNNDTLTFNLNVGGTPYTFTGIKY